VKTIVLKPVSTAFGAAEVLEQLARAEFAGREPEGTAAERGNGVYVVLRQLRRERVDDETRIARRQLAERGRIFFFITAHVSHGRQAA
jgi:hypothetical protein